MNTTVLQFCMAINTNVFFVFVRQFVSFLGVMVAQGFVVNDTLCIYKKNLENNELPVVGKTDKIKYIPPIIKGLYTTS